MTAETITLAAPAKINWGLAILGQRPDNYHLLRSLMQTVALADTVTLSLAEQDICLCPGVESGDNLAFRAWMLLKTRFAIPGHLRIAIEKRIPLGAGLAGGSSDAAAVLRGVNQLFGLGLSLADLGKLGLELGADLPFCIRGGLALAEGVGEQLTPLQPGAVWPLLLLNPGFPVATPRVYAAYDQLPKAPAPDLAGLRKALEAGDRPGILAASGNALEAAACQLHPELATLRQALLEQGLRPMLSGSGGTFFLLLEDKAQGEALAKYWRQRLPWVMLTQTTT